MQIDLLQVVLLKPNTHLQQRGRHEGIVCQNSQHPIPYPDEMIGRVFQ